MFARRLGRVASLVCLGWLRFRCSSLLSLLWECCAALACGVPFSSGCVAAVCASPPPLCVSGGCVFRLHLAARSRYQSRVATSVVPEGVLCPLDCSWSLPRLVAERCWSVLRWRVCAGSELVAACMRVSLQVVLTS